MERVTKKQSSEAREFAKKVLNYLHNKLSDKYTFAERLVGSAQWNTILKDSKGFWDIDYQLLLTSNSKEYLKNGLKNATKIKNDFLQSIQKTNLILQVDLMVEIYIFIILSLHIIKAINFHISMMI